MNIAFHITCNWRVITLAFFVFTVPIFLFGQDCDSIFTYNHPIVFEPEVYMANYTDKAPIIDGKLDDDQWSQAQWSSQFVDIEGDLKPDPDVETKIKMLWDSTHLYIGAYLEEEHIWATLKNKDDIIFYDDDFEVFIDADGDGHHYQEIEINAFNTIWDLWMLYPYAIDKDRNYLMNWEAKGLKSAIDLQGTINDPSDKDQNWTVEMAIPLHHLGKLGAPWRINFSRVDWQMEVVDEKYMKVPGTKERNWVWSPTGFINMHKPETWGYLLFNRDQEIDEKLELATWRMWKVYYSIKQFKKVNGVYPEDLRCFKDGQEFRIFSTPAGFDLYGSFEGKTLHLNEKGLIKIY